jgi:hypothetical protein
MYFVPKRRAVRPFDVLLFVALCVTGVARTGTTQTSSDATAQLDLSGYELRPLYENDFGRPQKMVREEDLIEQAGAVWRRKASPAPDAEWIAEGWGGAEVRDGRLIVAPSPFDTFGRPRPVEPGLRSHMVVWNRRIFPADFLLELEMSPCGSTNGLTIVLFCASGRNGEDIFDLSLPPRPITAARLPTILIPTGVGTTRRKTSRTASARIRGSNRWPKGRA